MELRMVGDFFDNDEFEKMAIAAAVDAHRSCVASRKSNSFEDYARAIMKAVGPYFQADERERVVHEADAVFMDMCGDPAWEGQHPSMGFSATYSQMLAERVLEGETRE
jgi:hypothetical protein